MIQDNSLAGLKKAELLMLHSNDIQHLQDEVFRDMKSLQVNKVKLLQSATNWSNTPNICRLKGPVGILSQQQHSQMHQD